MQAQASPPRFAGVGAPPSSLPRSMATSASGSALSSGWTSEEDEILEHCVRYGMTDWSDISQCLPGRSTGLCRVRWEEVVAAAGVFGTGAGATLGAAASNTDAVSPGRDSVGSSSVGEGSTSMSPVSSSSPSSSSLGAGLTSGVRQRGPGRWMENEDRILIDSQVRLGNQWTKISKLLPGR